MKVYSEDKIKNVAIVGHGGSGKTSMVEVMLFRNKVIPRIGRVEDGNTASDYWPLEQDRGISISTAICPIETEEVKINFFDTPGYVDFIGEVERTLPVVESVILNVNAVNGVEGQTVKMWKYIKKYKKTPLIFINKMDKEDVSFDTLVADLKNELGIIAPMVIPIGKGTEFRGVVNLLTMKATVYEDGVKKETEIPADMQDEVESMREELIEAIAEVSDELTEKYFDGEFGDAEIAEGLKIGFAEAKFTPLCCGSAALQIGFDELQEIIVKYMPTPASKETTTVINKDGETEELKITSDGKFVGFVFKTINEMHVGEISYVKILSGKLTQNEQVMNINNRNKEKVGNLMFTSGKNRIETPEVRCGDIVTILKLKDTKTSDTLCDQSVSYEHPAIELSEQVISYAIKPKTQADQEKVTTALAAIIKNDPTCSLEIDAELHQMILHGMGQIHLDTVIRLLKDKYNVNITTRKPRIHFRETITGKSEGHYRHKKQSGGAGQFGEVFMRVEPRKRGDGFAFVNDIFGGSISQQFVPSVEKGVKSVLVEGVVAGYPIIDVQASVYDGKEHPVDSKDIAFQIAGKFAFKDAFKKAKPVLLEPIFNIAVTVPDSFMGDIIGDLNSRRGRIMGMDPDGREQVIKAQVPMVELYQYINDLRSMTQGRGEYSLKFSHYEEVPGNIATQIIEESKQDQEEEE